MKKILGLAAGLLMTAMTFAQSGVTFSDAAQGYDKTAVSTFHFEFDSNYTQEKLNEIGAYYESYFTVATETQAGGTIVTIALIDDNEMARRVISRFFISLEVKEISADGTNLAVDDFMVTYIMK